LHTILARRRWLQCHVHSKSDWQTYHALVLIHVFLFPLPSSPRCRRLPISVVILARTTSFSWPVIHRPPVVTAAGRACRRHRHGQWGHF
jgi:hypothetical protein